MLTEGPRHRKSRKRSRKPNELVRPNVRKRCGRKPATTIQILQTEEVDRLLASALRCWEAKRDLIEQRKSTVGRNCFLETAKELVTAVLK
jgi:hypothetical protein